MSRSLFSKIPLRALMDDRRANVMVMFAGMAFALILMVGAGVDYTRATQFKTALQDAADSAALAGASVYVSAATSDAGKTAATNYFNAAKTRLPPYLAVGVPTITPSSDANGYYMSVTVTGTIKTTFLAVIPSFASIPVKVFAKAKDPIVTATVNLNGWTSDAGDGNSIYWYMVPADNSVPTFNAANISNHTYNLIFSNIVGTPPTLSFSIAAAQQMAFAFVNQTAAHSPGWNYCNQYGGCTGTSHIFYSQYINPNGLAYPNGANYTGHVVKNCSLEVTAYTTTAPINPPTFGATPGTSCQTPPAQINPYYSPSCASLGSNKVHYSWNDMGGNPDDTDYNDGQYNFSCTGGANITGVILTD